jgi:small subunit ribosomal protein S1
LSEGQVVQARIIRIDPARKRIGLSLRLHHEPTESSEKAEEAD